MTRHAAKPFAACLYESARAAFGGVDSWPVIATAAGAAVTGAHMRPIRPAGPVRAIWPIVIGPVRAVRPVIIWAVRAMIMAITVVTARSAITPAIIDDGAADIAAAHIIGIIISAAGAVIAFRYATAER
ncbi:hypothetical protein ASZ97_05810 [Brucella melitensis]|nr:Transmembrane protein, putative [Brucella melitensis NI]AHZ81084.1 hypothetical protein DA85_03775 [Brucella canis]AIN90275.1 hypothetical protein DM30_03945 [Brucella abortus]ALF29372.1 hypothetical protein NL70_03880 [Brucella abortus 104M]AOG49566.1 hypothetical protein BFL33_03815 [Brucella melitensis]EXU82066.1 hypothetical protein AX23_16490 [Brucella melitensis 548]KEX98880.1 hypothetical protein IL61_0209600 [Brucella ceti B1/94]KEY02524.1 hypothetical protein IL60_0203415 [Brucel